MTSERQRFDRILVSLHVAALDDAHWWTAFGLIDEALRAYGNSPVYGDGDCADAFAEFTGRASTSVGSSDT